MAVTRRIDDLGRLVLPKEYRKELGVEAGGYFEIKEPENGQIVLVKVESPEHSCIFCGSEKDLGVFYEKELCSDCINRIGINAIAAAEKERAAAAAEE